MLELSVKTDRIEREYSVGIVVPSDSGKDYLYKAALKAWDKFIADMAKRNWHHIDNQRPKIEGPRVYVPPITLPSRRIQDKLHPSAFVTDIPPLWEAELWLYTIKGNFWVDEEKQEVLIPDEGELPVNYSARIRREIARAS